jgi:hypothetical protein
MVPHHANAPSSLGGDAAGSAGGWLWNADAGLLTVDVRDGVL